MGTCAKCGAAVVDGNSWKEAYYSQLNAASEARYELRGFQILFAKHLMHNPSRGYEYSFDLVDAVKLGIAKYIPKGKNESKN